MPCCTAQPTADARPVFSFRRRIRRLLAFLVLLIFVTPQIACSPSSERRRDRKARSSSTAKSKRERSRTTPKKPPSRPAGSERADGSESAGERDSSTEPSNSRPAVTCGQVDPWDSDGDGISDLIELNNGMAVGACDVDRSVVGGTYSNGSLANAFNLPDRGPGYIHFRGGDPVDRDDWASFAVIRCLESVGREWASSDLRVNVGDLSLQPGGRFVPHGSHQNGLDLDVRYVRRDDENAPLDLRWQSEHYDPIATRELMDTFIRRCPVQLIFVDTTAVDFTNEDLAAPVLIHAQGHSNHFHVRLKKSSR